MPIFARCRIKKIRIFFKQWLSHTLKVVVPSHKTGCIYTCLEVFPQYPQSSLDKQQLQPSPRAAEVTGLVTGCQPSQGALQALFVPGTGSPPSQGPGQIQRFAAAPVWEAGRAQT